MNRETIEGSMKQLNYVSGLQDEEMTALVAYHHFNDAGF